MGSDQTDHPSPDAVRAFAHGCLDPAAASAIEAHLGACDTCCRLLERTADDTFGDRLRAARAGSAEAPAAPGPTESAPRPAADAEWRLRRLLDRWLDARESGTPASIDDLCRDDPDLRAELARRVEVFNRLGSVGRDDPDGTVSQSGPPAPDGPGGPVPDVPGYEVLGQLGRGGMGVVYKARHLRGNFLVALKMIRPGGRRPGEVDRFVREIELHAGLDHPHIIPVFHVGEHDGAPYFTMKLVEAGTLKARLDRFRLPAPGDLAGKRKGLARGIVLKSAQRIARLMAAVAEAVHHAHQHRLLHRDLKPGNILLHGKDHPYVADFGLVLRIDEAGDAGGVAGTAPYMAPEQTMGAAPLSTAADVYGLGAVLYELLTGRPPFTGSSTRDILAKVRTEPPVPPSEVAPDVPADLEAICLKCLNKDPAGRFPIARDVAKALTAFADRKPVPGLTPGRRRAALWVRRNPAATALAAVVAAAAALAVWWAIDTYQGYQQRLAVAEWNAYKGNIRDAGDALPLRRYGSALEFLEGCPPDLRNAEWYFLRGACRPNVEARLPHGSQVKAVAADLAGDRVATAGLDGRVLLWDLRTSPPKSVELDKHPSPAAGLAAGFGGRYLAAAWADGQVRVWDVTTWPPVLKFNESEFGETVVLAQTVPRLAAAGPGRKVRVRDLEPGAPAAPPEFPHEFEVVRCLALSPDGRWLAAGSMGPGPAAAGPDADKTIKVWDLTIGGSDDKFQLGQRSSTMSGLGWGRLGGRPVLAAASSLSGWLWDADTGRPLAEDLPGYESYPAALAFDRAGRRLAVSFRNGAIKLWDLDQGPRLVFARDLAREGEGLGVASLAFDSTGERLVYSQGPDAVVERWGRHGGVRVVPGHCFAFSPDGRHLAAGSADGSVRLFETAGTGSVSLLPPGTDRVAALAFRPPDGREVAVARGRAVEVLDTAGARVRPLPHKGTVLAVAYSPDGELLASSDDQRYVHVWSVPAGALAHRLPRLAEVVPAVAFSPDGGRLAVGCLDWSVGLYDVPTWERTPLKGHELGVTSVAFGPGGLLASGGQDRMTRLWAVGPDGGPRSLTILRHDLGVAGVAFAPAPPGRPGAWRLLSVGQDGAVRFWAPPDRAAGSGPAEVRRELLALAPWEGAGAQRRAVQIGLNPDRARRQLAVAFGDGRIELRDGD